MCVHLRLNTVLQTEGFLNYALRDVYTQPLMAEYCTDNDTEALVSTQSEMSYLLNMTISSKHKVKDALAKISLAYSFDHVIPKKIKIKYVTEI